MADRTVRAIFEARVSGAQKGIRDLATDVDKAGSKVDGLTKDLRTLDKQDAKPTIDVAIDAAKADVEKFRDRLTDLEAKPTTPKVDADITEARRRLDDAEARLSALRGAKAEMVVTADTTPAEDKIKDLGGEGEKAGEDAGEGVSKGILAALIALPIAGAIVGIGAAIGTALFKGIQDGLAIEAREDRFAAQVGIDPETARKFGRAAGEAYGDAWGDSVQSNIDVLRLSLQAGIIDEDVTEAEAEALIAQFQGVVDLFEFDMPMAVTGVSNLLKNGLARDAEQAFDLIVSAAQKVPTEDLMDTLTEYSSQWSLAGLSGEQAMGLIVQAMEAGARNTDLVADAVKEMGLRIREGTDPARKALQDLGLDADSVIAKFNAGDPSAMGQVFDALRQLRDDGGNTQEVIANLFGGPGEDLGAALFALNLDTAAEALGGLEGSAGAAERALSTMADNAATQIESAKRNIEIAADGIKGALAAAFSDEIAGAAEWVQRNRGPVMQFLADIVVGILDFAQSAVNGTATAYESFASFAASAGIPVLNMLASIAEAIEQILPGDQGADEFRAFADDAILSLQRFNTEAPVVADGMRDTFGGALDSMRTRFEEWAGPEIIKARIHDATLAMSEDLDAFSAKVNESGGTVTINGNTLTAEEALAYVVDSINLETGEVEINGQTYPAEQALEVLMGLVGSSEEEITIGGNNDPAQQRLADARQAVRDAEDDIRINGNTEEARARLEEARQAVRNAEEWMTVNANTAAAESAINYTARPRTVSLSVTATADAWALLAGRNQGGWVRAGLHEGGRVSKGLNAGGWVPGTDPGYDNVLWPVLPGRSGGGMLYQPLTGGEYVVNSTDARFWGPLLEWMDGGGRPPTSGAQAAPVTPDMLRRALDGATLTLLGVDYLSNATAARINTAIARSV